MNQRLFALMCRNIGAYRILGLCPYWVVFDMTISDTHPIGTLLGCGVTAFDRDDAIALLKATEFSDHPLPPILHIVEDVKFDQLEQNHVRPNMGFMMMRGVWYPQGYLNS